MLERLRALERVAEAAAAVWQWYAGPDNPVFERNEVIQLFVDIANALDTAGLLEPEEEV